MTKNLPDGPNSKLPTLPIGDDYFIPNMRFPGHLAPWRRVRLKDIATVHMGHSAPSSEIGPNQAVPYYGGRSDIVGGKRRRANVGGTMAKPFDLLVSVRAPVGGGAFLTEKVRLGRGYCAIRIKAGYEGLRGYLNFLFTLEAIDLERFASGTIFSSIKKSDLENLWISIPENTFESSKITTILDAVHTKEIYYTAYLRSLKSYKAGLTQKLFSQELRFTREDGSAFPEWKRTTLGAVSQVKTGSSNRQDSDEFGDFLFFDRSNDIRYSHRYQYDCEVIIVAGEGKSFPPRYFEGKFDLHQRAYAVHGFGDNVGRYVFHWMDWNKEEFLKRAVGSTMPSLRMDCFEKFSLGLPHPDEQRIIAEALSSIDAKISAVTDQITHIEAFKKGLLQQMFI